MSKIVQSNAKLNYGLFWADVEEQRANGRAGDRKPIRFWSIHFFSGRRFWELTARDLDALYSDFSGRPLEDDKRIALSAIFYLTRDEGRLEAEADKLRSLVANSVTLAQDLEDYFSQPQLEDLPEERRLKREIERTRKKQEEQTEKDKTSWLKFRRELRADPGQLSSPKNLQSWQSGMYRLWYLTDWLRRRSASDEPAAARNWRLLEEGFGRQIAEAYRDGMIAVWRRVAPARPVRKPGGATTVSLPTVLAYSGICVEATEDAEWVSHLSSDEAERAAKHGCLSARDYPEWIEALVNSHPQVVLPVLQDEIAFEWSAAASGRADFLNCYGSSLATVQQPVQRLLLERILKTEPHSATALDQAIRIFRNLHLSDAETVRLCRSARRRLAKHAAVGREDYVLGYLAALLWLNPDSGVGDLFDWIELAEPNTRRSRVQTALGRLFDRHDPFILRALPRASVQTLERLLQFAYANIRPEDDAVHDGVYSPDARDHAESARNAILSALLDRPGADAYRAALRASDQPVFLADRIDFASWHTERRSAMQNHLLGQYPRLFLSKCAIRRLSRPARTCSNSCCRFLMTSSFTSRTEMHLLGLCLSEQRTRKRCNIGW